MNHEDMVRKAVGILARRALAESKTPVLDERRWLTKVGYRLRDERGDELSQLIAAGATPEEAAECADHAPTLDQVLARFGGKPRKQAEAEAAEAQEQQAQTIRLQESTERIRAARAAWQPPSAEARLTARAALADARKAIGEQSPGEQWHERAVEERQRAWEARFDG